MRASFSSCLLFCGLLLAKGANILHPEALELVELTPLGFQFKQFGNPESLSSYKFSSWAPPSSTNPSGERSDHASLSRPPGTSQKSRAHPGQPDRGADHVPTLSGPSWARGGRGGVTYVRGVEFTPGSSGFSPQPQGNTRLPKPDAQGDTPAPPPAQPTHPRGVRSAEPSHAGLSAQPRHSPPATSPLLPFAQAGRPRRPRPPAPAGAQRASSSRGARTWRTHPTSSLGALETPGREPRPSAPSSPRKVGVGAVGGVGGAGEKGVCRWWGQCGGSMDTNNWTALRAPQPRAQPAPLLSAHQSTGGTVAA